MLQATTMLQATDSALLLSALASGLLGSTHCIGMCGGISAALSFALPPASRSGIRLFIYQMAYNSGRLLTYTILGVVVGSLAHGILGGWAQSPWPRFVAGLFMALMGLYLAGWWNLLQKLEGVGGGLWRSLEPLRRHLLPVDHPLKAIIAGAVWGFLPCGLVYSALTLALARSDSVASGAVMLAFGLGTLPALLVSGALAGQLRQWLQQRSVRQLAGALVILFGVWTAGMALYHASHHHHAGMAGMSGMDSMNRKSDMPSMPPAGHADATSAEHPSMPPAGHSNTAPGKQTDMNMDN
jgi:sulfite exporter TauE/SafE